MNRAVRNLHNRTVAGLVVLAAGFSWGFAAAPTAQAADAEQLAAQVQIRRTQYGVPHIAAPSLEAAAFGFAYCQAEDHWPSILRGIVGVRSELAATFGPDDKQGDGKNLAADLFNRQFRVYQRAVDSYHKLDPDYRAMCEGFAEGLNYYVEKHRQQLPAWAPKVTGHDVAAYGVSGVMRFAFNRGDLLKDFLAADKDKSAQSQPQLDAFDEHDVEVGSNMWAFAPSRSRSGRALLLGNPHQPWAPVSTYYEAHVTVPGRMNFYGSTFIGRPILTSGFNEHLGWSHTVNYPDLEELYELAIDPKRSDHYLFDGDSLPMTRDDVAVKVKTPTGTKLHTRTFWHTPLGPVVKLTPKKAVVLRSACYENTGAYEQWLKMTQCNNLAEFKRTLEMNELPMFNICYADRVGNIYYLWNGTVPNLPHPAHKAQAVPAARTADIWTRFHATAELPQLFNPPGGYVQNCNSPPFLTNLLAPLDPNKYPPHIRPNDLSLRTQHSLQLINNDQKYTLDEIWSLKHSPRMLLAERVKDDLLAALRAAGQSSELDAGMRAIEAWDNRVAADSAGGVLFANWAERYFPRGIGNYAVAWSDQEPMNTPRGIGDKDRAARLFMDALREVNHLYGRPDVRWGEAHRLRRGQVDLPLSGGAGTMGCFRVLAFRQDEDGKQVANSGDSYVFAVEFSDPPKAFSVLAYSQSELPDSPYYADQAPLFANSQMKRAAYTDAEIQAALVKAYRPGEE